MIKDIRVLNKTIKILKENGKFEKNILYLVDILNYDLKCKSIKEMVMKFNCIKYKISAL